MSITRQAFLSLLRAFVAQAIETEDQQWGRMLATVLEKRAIQLRLTFGGTRALGARTRASREQPPEEDWSE